MNELSKLGDKTTVVVTLTTTVEVTEGIYTAPATFVAQETARKALQRISQPGVTFFDVKVADAVAENGEPYAQRGQR